MKKKYILKKNTEFNMIIEQGKQVRNQYFIIYFLPCPYTQDLKFGVTVGKKNANAVNRNFHKRRIRHIIRENLLDISQNHYVIIVGKKALTLDFATTQKQLLNLFERLEKNEKTL
ncbi:MAG: ribonuclease P protein component [Mycoplasmatales bacterium]